MITYKFEIDKDACFVYFVQSLFKWSWYFDVKEVNYYLTEIKEQPTEKERKAIEKLKKILQKETNGYLWLWDRYSGKEIVNEEEAAQWQFVQEVFRDKFEALWQKESLKLAAWKNILQNYQFEKLNHEIFSKTACFFGVDVNLFKTVTVKLFFYHNPERPDGHVKKEYDNLIILNISNVSQNNIQEVISTLAHETIHLFDYASEKSELLKNSYIEIIKPLKLEQKNPSWHHLFRESVIAGIAGSLFSGNYLNQKLFSQPRGGKEEYKLFDYQRNKENYGGQIKAVASCSAEITAEYLNAGREMDEKYCNEVAITWLNLRIGKK